MGTALDRLRSMYKEDPKKVSYEGTPVLITHTNKIACIPTGTRLEKVGYCGRAGSGKTTGMHSNLHFSWQGGLSRCIFLNDSHNQSLTFSSKNEERDIVNKLNLIDIEPMRLPVIHLYPTIPLMSSIYKNTSHLKISLSIEKFLDNLHFIMDFKKFASAKYLVKIKEKLYGKNTLEEIEKVVDEELPQKQFRSVREKIKSEIGMLFRESIICASEDRPSDVWVNLGHGMWKENVVIALLFGNSIPCIMDGDIKNRPYYPMYLEIILREVLKSRKEGLLSRYNLPVNIYIDEMEGIQHLPIISEIVREGGPSGIGVVWASQLYTKVREDIRYNTNYLVCCAYNARPQIKAIQGDYDLKPAEANAINDFEDKFLEAALISKKEVYLYDLETGEREVSKGFFSGYLIPPPSKRRNPKKFVMPKGYLKYANNVLRSSHVGIYGDKNKIKRYLSDVDPEKNIHPLGELQFSLGIDAVEVYGNPKKSVIQLTNHRDIDDMGFKIVSAPAIVGGRIKILINIVNKYMRRQLDVRELTEIPKDLEVQYDTRNKRIRIRGPRVYGGATKWKNIQRT